MVLTQFKGKIMGNKRNRSLVGVVVILSSFAAMYLAAGALVHADQSGGDKKDKIRVGVYDSRAVAVAWAHSEKFDGELKSKMAEMEKAKANGDTAKVEELEAWGIAQQERLHLQGFGTGSVTGLLKHIAADIPAIARKTGVDIIVSKWEVVYQHRSAEVVDITDEIVKPFAPSRDTLKMIEELKKEKPVPEEQLKNVED
jgi:hypothetical protein